MTKLSVVVFGALLLSGSAQAQEMDTSGFDLGGTMFTNTYGGDSIATTSTTYAWPIGNDIYLGGNASTTYYQPSYTGTVPSMGTDVGSMSTTSYSAEFVYTW